MRENVFKGQLNPVIMRSDYGHNLLNLLKKFQRLPRNEIVINF